VLTSHHIIGDARRVLELLNERIADQSYDFKEWREHILSQKEPELEHNPDKLLPHEILETVSRLTDGNAIIATDVGQHQMWSCQYYHFNRPGQLLTSGGFGTMGFGYGAAFGAKLGNPQQVVVHCTGDGCFRMNCHEMATVQHYDIPVITIIFDNHTLGMVRQWQTLIYGQRYSNTTLDRGPDFVKLAEAYGIKGYRVTNVTEFEAAFQEALRSGHAAVIDCMLDMDEMVHPMVSGGSPVTNFLLD
jgi:acetolactate synthase-1/2/3 large subunit